MDPLRSAFLEEARTIIDRLHARSGSVSGPEGDGALEGVFLDLHTLKSSARAVGLHELGELFHDMEGACDLALKGGSRSGLGERVAKVADTFTKTFGHGDIWGKEFSDAARSAWENRGVPSSVTLEPPEGLRLSQIAYDRLMGVSESVQNARTRVEALGSSLLRTLVRSPKDRESPVAREYESAVRMLHLATADLDANLRDARMTPLAVFFERLPATVADLNSSLGKQAELSVSGGELQADRLVIGELGGALGHLVRNSIDHGIDGHGTVRVGARAEHDSLVVTVEDDGKGIRFDELLRIAQSKGFVPHEATLETVRKDELLFHPHLSTRASVTELSGRGVGMAAVREYVRSVGGRVSVESPFQDGKGTRVALRIPTVLSLMKMLLVRAGNATFGIPLSDIRETLSDEQSRRSWANDGDAQATRARKVSLSDILRIEGGYVRKGSPLVLRLDSGEETVHLLVDAVIGEEEVLVKALPRVLASLSAFRGAATISDGRTILVLDGPGLMRVPQRVDRPDGGDSGRLSPFERDHLMEVMNMVASHAGTAISRRLGAHIELSVPECADGEDSLSEEDWGASSIGVRLTLEGAYPGHLLLEIPSKLAGDISLGVTGKRADLHALSGDERVFFQELASIAMHAVGNMLSRVTKRPAMTNMSDIRIDARGALRTYFLSGHDRDEEPLVRVRLWFVTGKGIRTDDHHRAGSMTMELRRSVARKLLESAGVVS